MDLGGGGGGNAVEGQDLEAIETERLAFQNASPDGNFRLIPSAWPSDSLPPTTSSLLSIASSKGLIAAAGPDALVVAKTEYVRYQISRGAIDENTGFKEFEPQATIQIPRVSQLAFSSDESCLVISADQGGGLAVYDANSLTANAMPAFQLPTGGQSIRQLLPNPNPAQDFSRYFGVITTEGKLLMADLKEQKLLTSASGSTTFYENASCGCWSRLGKQIIVGLADGTAVQLDPSGNVKDQIPQPPKYQELKNPESNALPITSIYWIETNDFLVIHTPLNPPDSEADNDSIYHLAHRERGNPWTFFKFSDPCPVGFGDIRKPAHHFVQRMREWGTLNELIVAASTASEDIGVFTRSKAGLSEDPVVKDVFTTTATPEGRRLAMRMSDIGDTSPIGMAFDLSTKEKVEKPIPTDEDIDDSPGPVPALYVLDNEGILNMWWVVLNEAIRDNIPYPDLIAAGGPRPLDQRKGSEVASPASTAQPSSPMRPPSSTNAFGSLGQPAAATSQSPAFGQSAFGQPSTTPSQKPAFGQSAFGQPSTPAFGGTAALGNKQSPWGGAASTLTGGGTTFGKSTFGQPSSFGQPSHASQQPAFGSSAFGQVGGMGGKQGSVWGTPSQQPPQQSTPAAGGSVFGGNTSSQSPFMNVGGSKASTSGFGALGSGASKTTPSIFGEKKPSLPADPSGSTVSFGNNTSFGSGSTTFGVRSGFGSPDGSSTFGKPSAPASREDTMEDDAGTSDTASTAKPPTDTSKNAFGLAAGGFKLGSTFKGDGTAKDDLPKPKNPGAGLFGKGFGDALGNASKASSNSEGAAWLSGRSSPSEVAIKKEPNSEDELSKLKDIQPATPAKGEGKKAEPVDDAPLPPDPATFKPKPGTLPAPVPPGFGADFGNPKGTNSSPPDARFPLDFSTQKDIKDDAPIAGSPPMDVGHEKFSEGVPSDAEGDGPPEDEEEEWSDEDGEGEGEEDDGSEEGEVEDGDSEEEHGTPEITDAKGLSAFEARLTPASPKRDEKQTPGQVQSTTPATDKKESYTPAGLPPAPVMFAPPQRKGPQSPRSPSPQRSATSPLRPLPSFGAPQTPPVPSASQSAVRIPPPQSQQPASRPTSQAQQSQRIAVPPAQLLPRNTDRYTAAARPVEPEAASLEDEEDARIQSILSAPVEPATEVPAFLAHQDYAASGGEKSGIGGQIERVFRDINSMIDTLALNARALQGFVEGNHRPANAQEKGRFELEDEEIWVLGEASELSRITSGIDIELQDGKLEDVRGALEALREEEKEVAKLRAKSADARKRIQAKKDPEHLAQQANAALPVETQMLQADLRHGAQKVQTLLSKAEELLSVLRAELASQPQTKDQRSIGVNGAGVPTVEAVEKTIRKMTKMIEERSGDIDVLEARVYKLSPGALNVLKASNATAALGMDDLTSALKSTQISKSTSNAAALRASRVSAYGSPVAARRSRREGTPGTADSSTWKASLLDVSSDEIEAYRLKKNARRKAMDRLRETLESRGARVVKIGEA